MPNSIDDKILTDSLYLNRFDAGQRKRVQLLFSEMRRDLLAILTEGNVTEFNKQRIDAMIKQADDVINGYYNQAGEQLDIESLIDHVMTATQAAIQSTLPVTLAATLPTVAHMKSIASNVMFEGVPLKNWWAKQSADTRFKFGGIVRQGIIQGQGYNQLITPVSEMLDISKRNAFGLVHTSIQTVANDARMASFEANADVIRCLRWTSTLDSHTCHKCIGRSGKKWKVDKAPIGHSIPFQLPPIHFRDRCVMSAESIYTPEESREGFTRASSIGQLDAKITFDDYLKRVPAAQVEEMLGKGRYELWKSGKMTTAQMLDQTGRELTLKELRAKYN